MRIWLLLLAAAVWIIPLTVLPGSAPTIPDESEIVLDRESVELLLSYFVNANGTGVLQSSEGPTSLAAETLQSLFRHLEELSPGPLSMKVETQ